MERVINILIYLYRNYPKSNELSYSRVILLLYLIEWKYSIKYFEKLTDLEWIIKGNKPICKNLYNIFDASSNFTIRITEDYQNIIYFLNSEKIINFEKEKTKETIDFVIEHCKDLEFYDLNNIVSSTYAIINTKENQIINFVKLAKLYKRRD